MIHPQRQSNDRYALFTTLLLLLFVTTGVSPVWSVETRAVSHLFDLKQAGQRSLSLPSDVAVAPNGNIYIVDGGNHRIVVFSSQGKFLREIGGEKSDTPGQFNAPVGITVDQKGQIYVADSGNHRIQVFDRNENLIRHFPVRENKLKIKPIDVAVSPDNNKLYITGNTNHKVMVYSARGKLLTAWGKQGNNPGEFRYPATITVDKNGSIYVVDVLNSRIQIFTPQGKLLTTAGSWGVLPGQLFRPKGVALDNKEQIYVTDSYMDLVEVFDNQTRFSHVLGKANKPHKFISPGGLAIDGRNRIYVTEMLEHKVSVYKLK